MLIQLNPYSEKSLRSSGVRYRKFSEESIQAYLSIGRHSSTEIQLKPGQKYLQSIQFGQNERLSKEGHLRAFAAGTQFYYAACAGKIPEFSILRLITSSKERTIKTAEAFKQGFQAYCNFFEDDSIPTVEIKQDPAFDPPDPGDFKGLVKHEVYFQYCKECLPLIQKLQPKRKLPEDLDTEKGQILFGRELFRKAHLRSLIPVCNDSSHEDYQIYTWEDRRFATYLAAASQDSLQAIYNYVSSVDSQVHSSFVIHSHSILGILNTAGALTNKKMYEDPKVNKSELFTYALHLSASSS